MFWLFCSFVAVALSPIGRAIADRLAGKRPTEMNSDELRSLEHRAEVRILELEDRIEAAERFLRSPQGQ